MRTVDTKGYFRGQNMKGDHPVDFPKSDDSSNSADYAFTLDGAYFDVTRETCNLFALPDFTKKKTKKRGKSHE